VFEAQTYGAIMTRLLAAVPGDLDKREGSFIWDALSPTALELAQAYAEMDLVLQYGFAQTTYGQYLDYRAAEHGLTRKAAGKATGEVTITGTSGAIIPAGALVATGAGLQFATTAEVKIGEAGTVLADIEAVKAGAAGNVLAGAITALPVSIAGVTAVSNTEATIGGTDQETDTALLERILYKVQSPATSGNTAHYRQWALEVPGVGDAKVYPIWDGPGTVKVVILDTDKQPPDAAIVTAVTDYIETVRPVGATVTVVAASGVAINISAQLTLASYTTLVEVEQLVIEGVTAYLDSIAFKDPLVRYTRIAAVLLDIPPIIDYADLTVNGGISNIEMASGQIAVLGTVTLSE